MTELTEEKFTSRRKGKISSTFVTKDMVIKTCSEHFGFTMEDMAAKGKKTEIKNARHMTMYMLSIYTRLSYACIGGMFGGRDHTTVVHAIKTTKDLMDVYENVRTEVEFIKEKICYEPC